MLTIESKDDYGCHTDHLFIDEAAIRTFFRPRTLGPSSMDLDENEVNTLLEENFLEGSWCFYSIRNMIVNM